VAAHLGYSPAVIRVAFCVMAACGGAGILLYAWLWATTPVIGADVPGPDLPSARSILTRPRVGYRSADAGNGRADGAGSTDRMWAEGGADASDEPGSGAAGLGGPMPADAVLARVPIGAILMGIAFVLAAGAALATILGAEVPYSAVVPAVVVLVGAGLVWQQLGVGRGAGRGGQRARRDALVARTVGGVALVVLGILLFFVTERQPNVWTVFVAATAVLAGVGVVLTPWAVRLVRDLAAERAAREREAERAEVAAHLHDSVLQTLALIQQKAGTGSEVARLARTQEQDLRRWLFADPDLAEAHGGGRGEDLEQELRRCAAQCERDHAVRIEVVTTGAPLPDAPEPLLGAAREAMVNASRHAGGTVSVYAEVTPLCIEVSVRDQGPGFDLDQLPREHFGVRESILGRMRRAGGEADIRPGPGGRGTRVVLRMPRVAAEAAVDPAPSGPGTSGTSAATPSADDPTPRDPASAPRSGPTPRDPASALRSGPAPRDPGAARRSVPTPMPAAAKENRS
jgi:signal transduction histidine kinase